MSDTIAVSLRGVTKVYKLFASPLDAALDAAGIARLLPWRGRPREFTALKHVDLDVATGSRLGVIGRNGAGKSTLLKLITGALDPTAGDISVRGKVTALGTTGLGFHPEYSGYENIRASLTYNDLEREEYERAIDEVVEFCQLGDFLHQPLKVYSAGMQARLAFATSTAVKPDILIIDEVLSAGDAYFASRSAERMRRLTSGGCTVLLVSHGMQQILQYCEYAIWLEQGEIIARGPALEVVKEYEQFVRRLEREHLPFDNRTTNEFLRDRIEAVRQQQIRERTVIEHRSDTSGFSSVPTAAPQPETAAQAASKPLGVTEGGISHWPADGGLRIVALEFRCGGEERHVFQTGEPFEAIFSVMAESNGDYICSYNLVFYTEDAQLIGRVHSEPDRFHARRGEIRKASVTMSPLLLGRGEYVISAALFDDTDLTLLNEARCYDLVGRSFRIKVIANTLIDPGVVRLVAEWRFGQNPQVRCDAQMRAGEASAQWEPRLRGSQAGGSLVTETREQ